MYTAKYSTLNTCKYYTNNHSSEWSAETSDTVYGEFISIIKSDNELPKINYTHALKHDWTPILSKLVKRKTQAW